MTNKISVNTKGEKGYDIIIEKGILPAVGERVRTLKKAKRAAIVTDSNVAPLYLKELVCSFKSAGFVVTTFAFPAGESSKNLNIVSKILEFFCHSSLTRGDIAVALGGGVVGDLTGFASAIYLRGIDFVQVPTTLLAQVDSSVGGKTGCDLPFGKNLCGAFHNPIGVFIDTNTLGTLPKMYLRDGFSEAIKSGAILVPKLFELFENFNEDTVDLDEVVFLCANMKAGVVERDFTEKGDRILLNFGHTIGHAIEKAENFCGMTHGAAVSVGMAVITRASENAGITKSGTFARLTACLEKYNLPTSTHIPLETLAPLCVNDKKSIGSSVRAVVINDIGSSKTVEIPWDGFLSFLTGEHSLFKGVR